MLFILTHMFLLAVAQTGPVTVTFSPYSQDDHQQDGDADCEQGTGK